MPSFRRKTMTHRQRMTLILKPIVLLNYRTCHSQKRWAGVFVNDNFGEGYMTRLKARKNQREDARSVDGTGRSGRVTQYDAGIYAAEWERINAER